MTSTLPRRSSPPGARLPEASVADTRQASLAELNRAFATLVRVRGPALRPRDSAALILVDRSAGTPRILLGRRSPRLRFVPDVFVFPGGAVDAADRGVVAATELRPDSLEGLLRRSPRMTPDRARILAVAAVRELGEETGLLLGTAHAAPPPWPGFAENGLAPALDRLRFVARAVTPPGMLRRYDTRFFLGDAQDIAGEIPGIVGPDSELVELTWATLEEARALPMLAITRAIITELHEGLQSGFEQAKPVPFFRVLRGRFVCDELG